MKKVILLAVVCVATLASCKKDYTCACTGTGIPAGLAEIKYTKVKKKDAEASCSTINTNYKIYGTGISCAIK